MNRHFADESLGFLIGQTYRKAVQFTAQRLKEHDITPEQWSMLDKVSQHDGSNQKDIALRTGKDQPTTTRILEVLVKKGLVEKKVSETDRRASVVHVTEQGKQLLAVTGPLERAAMEEITQGLSPERVQLLRETLLQLSENIEQLMKNERKSDERE